MAAKTPKATEKEKKPRGQPTAYRPEYCDWARKMAKLGATDKDLAEAFEVTEQTINNWKLAHPNFFESLKDGKTRADAEVASKLFHRATGYDHEEVHVSNYQGQITLTPLTKHYAPDTAAAIFWLKNRRPDLWRDKVEQEVSGPGGGPVEVAQLTKEEFKQARKEMLDADDC